MGETYSLPPREPLLIVLSGPSGVGKDTVLQDMKDRNLPFHFVVTANTREIRPGETHGVDYFFVTKDEFARRSKRMSFSNTPSSTTITKVSPRRRCGKRLKAAWM